MSAPTIDDVNYYLTLFPPVRPRGYLEVRYLDAQPEGQWMVPIAPLADESTVDIVLDAAAPAAGRRCRRPATRLTDDRIAQANRQVVDLAARALSARTDIGADVAESIVERSSRHRI